MHRSSILLPFILATGLQSAAAETPPPNVRLPKQSMSRLETRLQTIDAELETLAHYSLRSGSGSIGYRSREYDTDEQHDWVEINLEQPCPIDEIVLVPSLRRDSDAGFSADGFPEELRIWAGTENDRTGTLIATLHASDRPVPRIAPLIIPVSRMKASWIQIEATRMSRRGFDGKYVFQLAEVLVFSGTENVALRQPASASSTSSDDSGAWDIAFLVDGHMPYLMDAARGQQSLAYIGLGTEPPSLSIDLAEPKVLSRIHLHAVDQSDTVPQAYFSDFGMPRHLKIEGANQADFSDARLLLETRRENITETGPIMMWRIPETRCRYVRITAPSPDPDFRLSSALLQQLARNAAPGSVTIDTKADHFRVGYAEIELFSGHQNVALGKTVTSENIVLTQGHALASLTDGRNLYGTILSIRDWVEQLARRQELETERPLIEAEINRRYTRQKTNLNRMYWISAILVFCIVGGLIIARLIHLYQLKKTKKRVAADLHDELGANLHAIGLFGDLAKMEIPDDEHQRWAKLGQYLDEVRALTEMSGSATRYFSHMLDAESYHENLIFEMKHTAARLLADLQHNATFPEDTALQHLSARKRIDLFLFYKECLTNIIRHSGASEVQTILTVNGNRLELTVSDNGIGLKGKIPPSLKRRAQLMRAKIRIENPAATGTRMMLKLRIKKA
jgi:signal transduction histidine kinase